MSKSEEQKLVDYYRRIRESVALYQKDNEPEAIPNMAEVRRQYANWFAEQLRHRRRVARLQEAIDFALESIVISKDGTQKSITIPLKNPLTKRANYSDELEIGEEEDVIFMELHYKGIDKPKE